MKAIRVDENHELQFTEIAEPSAPPPGYVIVRIAAATINPGDKFFLKSPAMLGPRIGNIWGASAAGTVVSLGADVPDRYRDRKVAIYRSLQRDQPVLGLWSELAMVPYLTCQLLPDHLDPIEYSGSLVNVATAYAFLDQVTAEGHGGIVVTAGGSATGRAVVMLAERRGIPTVVITRKAAEVPGFLGELEQKVREVGATAVFDGVGGDLASRILPVLAPRSCLFCYGFLAGPQLLTVHTSLLMTRDLTIRRFSNFESPTVRDPRKLEAMLMDLENCIADPVFRTKIGKTFALAEFDAAMRCDAADGSKPAFILP